MSVEAGTQESVGKLSVIDHTHRPKKKRSTVKPRLSQHLPIEYLPFISNAERLPLLHHQPDQLVVSAHAPQQVVSRAFAVYHKFKSEGYSRLSLRITWPLLLIGGGKNGRVYCDKRERQVAINGCCDKQGFTVIQNGKTSARAHSHRNISRLNLRSMANQQKVKLEMLLKNIRDNKFEIIKVRLIVSRLNPWLACSPDGIILRDKKPIALLEI